MSTFIPRNKVKYNIFTLFQSFFSKSDYSSGDMRDTVTDMSTKGMDNRKISNMTSSTDVQTKTSTVESK